MNKLQFRQLIREEIRKVISEANVDTGALEDLMSFLQNELKSTAAGRNRYDAISNDIQGYNKVINALAKTNPSVKKAKSMWSSHIRVSEDDVKGQHATYLALWNALSPIAKDMGISASLPVSAKTYKGK